MVCETFILLKATEQSELTSNLFNAILSFYGRTRIKRNGKPSKGEVRKTMYLQEAI